MLVKWHFWKALWLFVHLGAALNADLNLEPRDSGFFLRPLFGPQSSSAQADSEDLDALEPDLGTSDRQAVWVDNTPFVINNAHRHVLAKVVYGPYSAEEYISAQLLDAAYANQTGQPKNIVVGHLDISAHIVSRSITQDRPTLQVLFHASSILSTTGVNVGPRSESKWCLQMHAQPQRDVENELRSVCVLSDIHNVCVADIVVPTEWWLHEHLTSADVYFSAYPIDDNLQCSSAHTVSTVKQGDRNHALPSKRYIGSVTLSHGQLTYQEVREDQHVLIYIPQKNFYPGFKFRVPVKLQAESDLEVFVVRVKARHGVTVIGAEATNPEKWRISLDLNNKRHGAMVTAFIKDKDKYVKTDRIQEVFDWIFEVDEDAVDDDAGRIILNLEYEMNNMKQERYGSVQNRVVVRVHIQHDNVNTIIPIIKQTELVNTAMLTGRLQASPMQIYSMNQVGKVTDITSQTTCHSGDEDVLKVAESCNMVYLDGTESKGSPSVNVIAKYGRHTKFLFFKVWVPELPLDVELSDNKLSQIKAWKAPVHQANVPIQLQRHPRGFQADSPGMATHPDLIKKDGPWQKGSQKKMDSTEDYESADYSTSCHLKFQQAEIQVYAHFYNQDSNRNQYLTHRKAKFRITDLIEDRLRIADSSIASLSGNIVQGLQPGRTEVQVLSQMGRVVGAKEIRVGNNKVTIQRLEVDVVTGVSLSVEPQAELPGTLMAKITRRDTLHKKYQEAILDVNVLFSDGTRTPIRHVPPSDYFLDMDTLNNHVVAFGPMFSADQPRIIALGEGSGELLKLALELGDACQRKKSRPLAVSYVYVNVDLSKDGAEKKDLQNDGQMRYDKGRNTDADVKAKGPMKQKPKDASDSGLNKDMAMNDIVVEGLGDNVLLPSHEAQQQHVSTTREMTPLEIGMYVLLGIFCVAIVVFMVHCMVFVWRYRHKRMPYEMTDSIQNANEWVWIGKATLERNSINTACSQTLVPESDFNGNQSPGSNLLAPSGTTNARNSNGANVSNSSNRNSVVSTYKGSECSIRITSNPHPDVNSAEAASAPDASQPPAAGSAPLPSTSSAPSVPCTPQGAPIPPPRTTSAGARPPSTGTPLGPLPSSPKSPQPMGISSSDTGSTDDSSEEEAPPLPPKSAQLLGASPPAGGNLNLNQLALQQLVGAEGGMTNLNIVNNNSMQEELWDYEAMGLTYEQLMEYFDNLKESTA